MVTTRRVGSSARIEVRTLDDYASGGTFSTVQLVSIIDFGNVYGSPSQAPDVAISADGTQAMVVYARPSSNNAAWARSIDLVGNEPDVDVSLGYGTAGASRVSAGFGTLPQFIVVGLKRRVLPSYEGLPPSLQLNRLERNFSPDSVAVNPLSSSMDLTTEGSYIAGDFDVSCRSSTANHCVIFALRRQALLPVDQPWTSTFSYGLFSATFGPWTQVP
jgi:hypothetical protein